MNREFIYLDDRVMVQKEDGNYFFEEYRDNIKEILEKENLIETLTNEKKHLKELRQKFVNLKVGALEGALISAATVFSVGVIPGIVAQYIFQSPETSYIIMTIFSLAAPVMGCVAGVAMHVQNKKDEKEIEGIDGQLKFIYKELMKEKKELRKLQKNKTNNNAVEPYKATSLLTDKQILPVLEPKLKMADDLGKNGKKYYKYYLDSELEQRLDGVYTEDEINQVRDYVVEKGPTLVKRKTSYKKKR